MSDSTKTLVGTIAGLAALVAIFAIMSDCSKAVSRTGSDAVEACIKSGGQWVGNNDGIAPNINTCIEPEQRK